MTKEKEIKLPEKVEKYLKESYDYLVEETNKTIASRNKEIKQAEDEKAKLLNSPEFDKLPKKTTAERNVKSSFGRMVIFKFYDVILKKDVEIEAKLYDKFYKGCDDPVLSYDDMKAYHKTLGEKYKDACFTFQGKLTETKKITDKRTGVAIYESDAKYEDPYLIKVAKAYGTEAAIKEADKKIEYAKKSNTVFDYSKLISDFDKVTEIVAEGCKYIPTGLQERWADQVVAMLKLWPININYFDDFMKIVKKLNEPNGFDKAGKLLEVFDEKFEKEVLGHCDDVFPKYLLWFVPQGPELCEKYSKWVIKALKEDDGSFHGRISANKEEIREAKEADEDAAFINSLNESVE